MINLVWSGLLTLLLLSGCGYDGTTSRVNDFVPLTSIEIVPVYSTIAANTSTKLSVKGNFSGLFTRDITDQAVWSSNSPTVADFKYATTPNKNRVTGIAPGPAILTATVGGVSATYTLTVSSATISTLVISPANPTVANGLTTQFTATGTFSDSTTQDLTFDVTWSSTPGTFATVSNDPASKGLATSTAEGTETISASFASIPTPTTVTTTLIVAAKALKSIAVSSATTSVLSLSTANFKATGTYTDNSTSDITSQVAWTSSRPDLATIASGGVATTLAQGTTSISATLGGFSGGTNLKVTGGNLSSFTVSPATVTLVKGTVVPVTAKGNFSNGTTRDITKVVAWSTANSALATVTPSTDGSLWLNAIDVTPATMVSATYVAIPSMQPATSNLTIIAAPALNTNGLTISAANLNLTVGTSSRFTVSAAFNGGPTLYDVTASSDWTSTGGVSVGNLGLAKGRVKGLAAGPATISATFGGQPVTVNVTVTARTIQSLTVFGSLSATPGDISPFATTATYTDNTSLSVTDDTIWTIDNANVAIPADSTNQPGQVITVDSGSAALTATFGGLTKPMTISVP